MRLFFTSTLAVLLVACGNSDNQKSDTKATEGSKVIEQPTAEVTEADLGPLKTKLTYGWRRVELVNSDRVNMTDSGVEVTAKWSQPDISFDKAFLVDANTKYEIQVDYEIYDDLEGVTPIITAWILGEDGKLLDEEYKIKYFNGFSRSGTLSANFHMPGATNVDSNSVALPAGTVSVVFSANPVRGRNGARGLIKRFDVTSSE